MKFSIKDFFNKCDQIHSFLRIWLHLMKKSLMENFIFCAVYMWTKQKQALDVFHKKGILKKAILNTSDKIQMLLTKYECFWQFLLTKYLGRNGALLTKIMQQALK